MSARSDEQRLFESLNLLVKQRKGKGSPFSPNDVLVQVSLPLVLILAIAIRLMSLGQAVAMQDSRSRVLLELWKQQFILRADRVLEDWEKDSGISVLPHSDRIQWARGWPDDERFRVLCSRARDLDDLPALSTVLYRRAIELKPDAASDVLSCFFELYDPDVLPPDDAAQPVPELLMTPERRAYAMRYLEQRCRRWRTHVEELQWGALERVLERLSVDDRLSSKRPTQQLRNLAEAMDKRGYPLLPAVLQELYHGE